MAHSPSRSRRFLIILIELFFILQLYRVLRDKLPGLPFNAYLLVCFVMFWFLNFFFSHIQFGPNVQEYVYQKWLPRMQFSSDFFGVVIAAAMIAGFFFAGTLGSAFLVYLIIVVFGIFAFRLIYYSKNMLRTSWGLALVGFLFGVAIGNNYTSNVVIAVFFIAGGLFLYLSHEPGAI